VSERSWIVLDLVVHGAWSLHEDDSEPDRAWRRVRDELGVAPHQVVSWSNSGEQALIYAVTTDADLLVRTAQQHAPTEGVASFVAKIWKVDPRQTEEPPVEIELITPQPSWPRAGYANELLARWVRAASRESSISPN
jgi:hypothetical protein